MAYVVVLMFRKQYLFFFGAGDYEGVFELRSYDLIVLPSMLKKHNLMR
jgi:hypothetical protein